MNLQIQKKWETIVLDAFGESYDNYFETVLGPIFIISKCWGEESGSWPDPIINISKFLAETTVDPKKFSEMMELMSADRESHQSVIRNRLVDGLPLAPTSLLYRPFVKIDDNIRVAASPWAVQHQLRFFPWVSLLNSAKRASVNHKPDHWFRAFGQQLELWCRLMANEAQKSTFCKAKFHLPKAPGGVDEVEDVALIEGRAVVLFSVKSRVMTAQAAHEAFSVSKTLDWYKDYFFENKGDDYRGGAVRQLDRRVQMIREGKFEEYGINRNVRILPVIVSYDSLGESDTLYRWLERQCLAEKLLQGPSVGPVTLADIEDFEALMAYVADGKSVVQLLRKRETVAKYRRLDQIIAENPLPQRRKRLPIFEREFKKMTHKIIERLFVNQGKLIV